MTEKRPTLCVVAGPNGSGNGVGKIVAEIAGWIQQYQTKLLSGTGQDLRAKFQVGISFILPLTEKNNEKIRCILRSFCIFAENSNYGEN